MRQSCFADSHRETDDTPCLAGTLETKATMAKWCDAYFLLRRAVTAQV